MSPAKSAGGGTFRGQTRVRTLDLLEKSCSDALSILREIVALSETETIGASQLAERIHDDARTGVEALKPIVHRFDTKQTQGIASALKKQARVVSNFTLEMRDKLLRQSESIDASATITAGIIKQISGVHMITSNARLLTINAKIEAAHLGAEGRGFSVIAEQLRDLSAEVASANGQISELATRLAESIPLVLENSRQLVEAMQEFSNNITEELSSAREAYDLTQNEVESSLRENQQRVASILIDSRNVMARLQFQDRVAQGIQRVQVICKLFEELISKARRYVTDGGAPIGPEFFDQLFDFMEAHLAKLAKAQGIDGLDASVMRNDSPVTSGDVEFL